MKHPIVKDARNFHELLSVWAHLAPTFQGDIWEGNPTQLAMDMHLVRALAPIMREWRVDEMGKALSWLAWSGRAGVESVERSPGRIFRLTKSKLNQHQPKPTSE